jgi:hypothetical protein
MRRFLTLVCLLCLAIPAGISVSGCTRDPGASSCNGLGYGLKIGQVAAITLTPQTSGISIAFGQTRQVASPTAVDCKGNSASAGTYTYGTTNNQLVDISPTGNICAGTWNRNSGGGIANYTICSPPNPLPSTSGLPYGAAYVTASAKSITSNPVEVYVHPQVTSVSLVTTPVSGGAPQCYSQGAQAILDAQACYSTTVSGQPTNVLLCAPSSVTSSANPQLACPVPTVNGQPVPVSSIPNCTAAIGSLTYNVSTSAVADTLTNNTTNQVTITSQAPGTTAITATVAGSASSAGYFTACPPKSISLSFSNNGATTGTVTQGATAALVTSVLDTNNNPITGLTLTYQSTDPSEISAASSGSITANFPGTASVYATCQPPNCNSAPTNEIGLYGTGLPVSSNPVTITSPGTASDYVWFAAPGQSQYIVAVDLLSGTVGSTIRLPYVPNSMAADHSGTNLYFGSTHELMIFSTASNSVTLENTSAPGVVLSVAPNDFNVVVNDQARQIFYLYPVLGGQSPPPFGGIGNAAAWTPDGNTLYITDNAALNAPANSGGASGHSNTLYVYNAKTGWAQFTIGASNSGPSQPPNSIPYDSLPPNVAVSNTNQTPAVVIPAVGAYLRGVSSTPVHTWCPSGTVGNYASMIFYPDVPASAVPVSSDVLAATTDGQHILSAASATTVPGPITLSDTDISIPSLNCLPPAADNNPLALGDPLTPLVLTNSTPNTTTIVPTATAVNQIVVSPQSNLAFVTYTADSNPTASLPFYLPNQATPADPGTVGSVPLKSSATSGAPLAGAFTPDDRLFFVSTAGDNLIHYISVPLVTSDPANADIRQINPNLPACSPATDLGCSYNGTDTVVPVTAIAVRPRPAT